MEEKIHLNNKQKEILGLIFATPIPANIVWKDIESLFIALGADISQGRGSRVRVNLNRVRAIFHEPHPQKETDKGAVKSVRDFLMEAGIEPESNNY